MYNEVCHIVLILQAHWRSEIEKLLEGLRHEVASLQGNTELIRKRQEELK